MATISALVQDNLARLGVTGLRDALSAFVGANQDRIALWLPVLFGAGIAVYFALPTEPGGPYAAICAVALAVMALLLRRSRGLLFGAAVAASVACAGFAAAQFRTDTVAAPVLARDTGPVRLTGRVLHAEPAENGVRLTLDRVAADRIPEDGTPARIRITVRAAEDAPRAGDRISALAVLRPPPAPSMPGGFDFARKAWFERLGAVGFALGAVTVERGAPDGGWRLAIARLRQTATARILDASGNPVAAALMTGERRAIPDDTLAAMRDSGLAHLLPISGLHIGLVAGLLFFAVRLVLAAVEPVALRFPVKKIAAVAALAGAAAYLALSGATIPTQRAFVMVAIVLFAVTIDRTAISLRLVAIAAAAVLVMAPESLLSASFQMSFAAVVALIAVYEAAAPRLSRVRRDGGAGTRIGLFLAATLLTTGVATLATAPFAGHHFNRLALYGLLANMIAVPLMALWIMPLAIAGFLLVPFGGEALALVPMGWGIDAVLWVARGVAGLPGAVLTVPALPTAALAVVALGGLWL